jgi:hypothetical protein
MSCLKHQLRFRIPLPGELTNGVPARFDKYGTLYQPKRVYKKKVSPQCPFCDKRYRNEHSLKKHISKKHPEYAEFVQCLKCFKALKDENELQNHLCEMVTTKMVIITYTVFLVAYVF